MAAMSRKPSITSKRSSKDSKKASHKALVENMASLLDEGGEGVGHSISDMVDDSKRQERIVNAMLHNKKDMSGSLSKLDRAMLGSFGMQPLGRKSGRGSVLDSTEGIAAANKMREYTQSANGSQAADIHARFYAENALQSSQYDAEVNMENRNGLSIRQLLSVDPRMDAVKMRDARFEAQKQDANPDDVNAVEFTAGLRKRDIVSYREMANEKAREAAHRAQYGH
jgi:hypothetical protein